jgi:hypothetical protein
MEPARDHAVRLLDPPHPPILMSTTPPGEPPMPAASKRMPAPPLRDPPVQRGGPRGDLPVATRGLHPRARAPPAQRHRRAAGYARDVDRDIVSKQSGRKAGFVSITPPGGRRGSRRMTHLPARSFPAPDRSLAELRLPTGRRGLRGLCRRALRSALSAGKGSGSTRDRTPVGSSDGRSVQEARSPVGGIPDPPRKCGRPVLPPSRPHREGSALRFDPRTLCGPRDELGATDAVSVLRLPLYFPPECFT